MNAFDWVNKTAEFMHRDRPDVFKSVQDARSVLSAAYDSLACREGSGWTSFAGFILHKHEEEDEVIEFNLAKKISSIDLFPKDLSCSVHGWTETSGALKVGVDLPSPGL